jgi:hypothetical protein
MTTYNVVRYFRDDKPCEIIKRGLSKEDAMNHCLDAESHGVDWFDGWTEET